MRATCPPPPYLGTNTDKPLQQADAKTNQGQSNTKQNENVVAGDKRKPRSGPSDSASYQLRNGRDNTFHKSLGSPFVKI